jgi:hypothetical protein
MGKSKGKGGANLRAKRRKESELTYLRSEFDKIELGCIPPRSRLENIREFMWLCEDGTISYDKRLENCIQ